METDDRLGRAGLVDYAVTTIVGVPGDLQQSRIVGVLGPWGSGKSWLLEQVRPRLAGHTRSFNPWLFSDELGLFRGFSSFLLERVRDEHTRTKVATALDYIGPSLKGFGVDLSGSVSKAADAITGFRSPEEMRDRLTASFAEAPGPAYILIDDVDRLTPGELMMLFKMLRLLGDLPNVVYVMAYDEDTLIHLMTRTEIAFQSPTRARDYLDKIVEARIVLPPITADQKRDLILAPLLAISSSFHSDLDRDVSEEFAWRAESFTFHQLSSLRVIERFLASVRQLPSSLRGEVNYLDWVLVSYLRVVEPHALRWIVDNAEAITKGLGRHDFVRDKNVLMRRGEALLESLVDDAGPSRLRENLVDIVDFLFPQFQAERSGSEPRHYGIEDDQRIADLRYFYRYFWHEFPDGAISDVAVEKLLVGLADERTSNEAHERLADLWKSDPHAVFEVISRRWRKVVQPSTVFSFLATLETSNALEYVIGPFELSGAAELRIIAMSLLPFFDEDELSTLRSSTPDIKAETLYAEILLRSGSPAGSAHFVDWVTGERQRFAAQLSDRLNRSVCRPTSSQWMKGDAEALRLLNKPQLVALASRALADRSWTAADAVAAFLVLHPRSGGALVEIAVDIEPESEVDRAIKSAPPSELFAPWQNLAEFEPALGTLPSPPVADIAAYYAANWGSTPRRIKLRKDE